MFHSRAHGPRAVARVTAARRVGVRSFRAYRTECTRTERPERLAVTSPRALSCGVVIIDVSRSSSIRRTKRASPCSIQTNGDWMTISVRSPDKEPTPPKQINFAEPLVESVRVYLANELPSKQLALVPRASESPEPATSPPATPVCDVDIATHTAHEEIKGINFEARLKRNDLNNNSSRNQNESQQNGAMPSQAELMQRQPLLARTAKADAPQPTTDESDPDQDHSPQRMHAGEFIVEIPAGAVREERYPKEIWKTILSFFFLFICVCINMMSLSLVHERLPDRNTTPPLNDIVLDNVEAQDWGLAVSEYMIMISTTVAMIVVVFHKHRFIVARRLFIIIGLLYLYRAELLDSGGVLTEEAVADALGTVGLGAAGRVVRAAVARALHGRRGDRVLRDDAAVLDVPLAAGDAAPRRQRLQPLHDPARVVVLAVHVPGA
ncbi:unnamed protein product [Arctia plantaginis]|uniref:Uncharacterized protein n=1 Tax=Arctia plantaginis TaxID=874455 RepID=A0A8S0YR65_ARCPL|nr:unnamed protein product [Arctia plantaginis]